MKAAPVGWIPYGNDTVVSACAKTTAKGRVTGYKVYADRVNTEDGTKFLVEYNFDARGRYCLDRTAAKKQTLPGNDSVYFSQGTLDYIKDLNANNTIYNLADSTQTKVDLSFKVVDNAGICEIDGKDAQGKDLKAFAIGKLRDNQINPTAAAEMYKFDDSAVSPFVFLTSDAKSVGLGGTTKFKVATSEVKRLAEDAQPKSADPTNPTYNLLTAQLNGQGDLYGASPSTVSIYAAAPDGAVASLLADRNTKTRAKVEIGLPPTSVILLRQDRTLWQPDTGYDVVSIDNNLGDNLWRVLLQSNSDPQQKVALAFNSAGVLAKNYGSLNLRAVA